MAPGNGDEFSRNSESRLPLIESRRSDTTDYRVRRNSLINNLVSREYDTRWEGILLDKVYRRFCADPAE